MFIIKNKKIFISISAVLVAVAIVILFVFPPKVGIDFKGGALTEVSYKDSRPSQEEVNNLLKDAGFSALVQPTGELGYLIKSPDLTETDHQRLLTTLSNGGKYSITENNFNSIGPSVGKELTRKAIVAIVLVSLAIILFIAFALRKVSKPVASWKYGVIAVIALLHDVIIPSGIFALLSKFYGAEMDTLFVVAVLTILGLSVSDTIVIFDRIRENLRIGSSGKFKDIVGMSLDQSYTRSIMTSVTVIMVLLALVFVGPESTKYFAIMLTAGMFFGTYSSIFLASPLLVILEEMQNKK